MATWILLIHNIPPRPLYLRAKIRGRLAQVGAIPIKNSVYVLPRTPETVEDLQWIGQEIMGGGGQAHVMAADFLTQEESQSLVSQFNAARTADYALLIAATRTVSRPKGRAAQNADLTSQPSRLRRRLDEIRSIDFFDCPRGEVARKAIAALESSATKNRKEDQHMLKAQPQLRGRTWRTRPGIKVDRIASAWFVRRFIDPKAKFRFVDPAAPAQAGEIRFDMVGADFTHEGDRCTLETLVKRIGTPDRGVKAIAEIVHDLDLKDEKFGRPETLGIQKMIEGLVARHDDDVERMERGLALFDDLHRALLPPSRPRKKSR